MTKSRAYNKGVQDWKEFPNTDIVWVDPPWGAGFVKYFNTMMKKQTGKESDHTLFDILRKIATGSSTKKPVIIEYSVKESDQVIAMMKKYGHTHNRTINGVYANKLPFVMLVFNCTVDFGSDGFKDEHYVKILRAAGYKSAFDPCAGIGHTAKIFLRNGWTYLGSEINAARYERLHLIIEKHNGKNNK